MAARCSSTKPTWCKRPSSYIFQITKEFSVQPDIQYIIQPGGFGQTGNALVLGLQVAVDL